MIRRILYEGLLILLIAVIVSISVYMLRPKPLPLFPQPPSSGQETAAVKEKSDELAFSVIELEPAVEMFHNQTALFADARPRTIFLEGHIQGAVNLDPYAFDQWSEDIMKRFPPDQAIITYCDGRNCPLSAQLAEKLTWLGLEHVYSLEDGWTLWQQAGLPISTGEE